MAALNYCGRASKPEEKNIERENHDRLMALYHTGTDVKRSLLNHYLTKKKIDLAGYLSKRYDCLPTDDVKRASRSKNIQLSDLGIYAIDILLTNHCYDLFWECCLDKASIESILNTFKKDLYSLYQNRKHDNASRKSFRKEKCLSKIQWECLYKGPDEKVINEIGFNLSKIRPNKELTTQSFDDDMNSVLLSTVCPLYRSVAVVTENQMTISQIAVEHEINKEVFDQIWELLETNLIHISSHCICEGYYKQKLDTIKKSTFNRLLAQENRKYILESSFNNPEFLKDTEFLDRVQEELNLIELIEVEETKYLAKKFCGKETHIVLVNGQFIAGSYPLAVLEDTRKDLDCCRSVCSRKADDLKPILASEKIDVLGEQRNIDRHNYLKLVYLIQDVAKDVLVEVLKGRLPGADFGNAFNGMKKRLLSLLNGYQIQKLYPEDSKYTGDLSDMDISLLYIILRNIGTICPHQNGWGKEPEEDDRSISANIDRIRIAKNAIVSHSSNYSIEYIEFRNSWTAMRQCCVDLGDDKYKERIDVLLTSLLNCDLEQQMCEIFESLKEQDLQNEKHSRRLEEVVECLSQLSDYVKKEHLFGGRETSNENSESCTLGTLRIKGNKLPDEKKIEKQIGDYHNKDLRVTSVDDGSVVISLAIFTTAFENFGYFLTVIDRLLQRMFSFRPVSEDKRSDTISISVELYQPSEKKEGHSQYLTTRKTQRKKNKADSRTPIYHDSIRIVLMGRTGVGKSKTGNTILNRNHFGYGPTDDSMTYTCELAESDVMGKRVSIVDTPGFFRTNNTYEQTRTEIARSIYMSAPGPHAVLLVCRIGRTVQDDIRTFKECARFYGDDLLNYIIVVFTEYDMFLQAMDDLKKPNTTLTDYVQKLPNSIRDFIISRCKSRYVAFDNTLKGKKSEKQVLGLFTMIDRMLYENGGFYYTNADYQMAESIIRKEIEKRIKEEKGKPNLDQMRFAVQTSEIGSRRFSRDVSFANRLS